MKAELHSTIWFRYEQASAKLVLLSPDVYALSNVWSNSRGKGHAKVLMSDISAYADHHQLTLRLIVQRYGKDGPSAFNNDDLEAFYERFGFQRDSGSRRPHTMTRVPSQKIHAP